MNDKKPKKPTEPKSRWLKHLFWVRNLPMASADGKNLLDKLAKRADPDGRNIFPSIKTMAKDMGTTESTVRRQLARLLSFWIAPDDEMRARYIAGWQAENPNCTIPPNRLPTFYRLQLDQLEWAQSPQARQTIKGPNQYAQRRIDCAKKAIAMRWARQRAREASKVEPKARENRAFDSVSPGLSIPYAEGVRNRKPISSSLPSVESVREKKFLPREARSVEEEVRKGEPNATQSPTPVAAYRTAPAAAQQSQQATLGLPRNAAPPAPRVKVLCPRCSGEVMPGSAIHLWAEDETRCRALVDTVRASDMKRDEASALTERAADSKETTT